MPAICTAAVNTCGEGHFSLVVEGVTLTLHTSDLVPLIDEEKLELYTLAVRHKGIALAQLLNRVIYGDEATNVKIYTFFGPGAAITKTNIGTAYVDIAPGFNGERVVVDFTGCTEYRFLLSVNRVGAGQKGVRVVRDGDGAILHESATIGTTGEFEGDTDWQLLPAAFLGQGLAFLRAEAKSTTGTDDPVFRRLQVGLR